MTQQDSIAPLPSDSESMLQPDSLFIQEARPWRARYDSVVTLTPGNCFIMPMPEDTAGAGHAHPDLGGELSRVMAHSFFTDKDSTLRTDLPYRSYGMAGDPVPYTVRGDNAITILLILCFIFFVVSVAHSQRFIIKQMKGFFYVSHSSENNGETGGELRFQAFLATVDCLVLAIGSYLLATQAMTSEFMFKTDLTLIAYLFAAFLSFFAFKLIVGTVVNSVFFDVKKNLRWIKALLFLTACEGVLLFPMLLFQVYFDFSAENSLYYFGFVLILNKILTFYKCWQIFFKQKGLFLQNILYFCALEIAPLLAFGGAWLALIDFLKINF